MSKKLWFLVPFIILLVTGYFTNVAYAKVRTTSQNLNNNPAETNAQNEPLFAKFWRRVKVSTFEIKTPLEGNSTPLRRSSVKIDWLDKLGEMENCPTTGLLDSNGKKSYGKYCFQKDTFIEAVNKYREEYDLLPYAEEAEFGNWLSDEKFQRKLVEIIVLEEQDLIKGLPRYSYKWYTTIHKRGLGLAPIE